MRFYGRESVIEMRMLHQEDTGKVTSGTLRKKGSGDTPSSTAYSYLSVAPVNESTGIGAGGVPEKRAKVIAFQEGEAEAPRPDDYWTIGGTNYLIVSLETALNADANYAVHDCQVVF